MSGWIPVSDRLPEKRGRYLVVEQYPLSEYSERRFISICGFALNLEKVDEYDFEGLDCPGWYGYDDEYGYFRKSGVTHWMPLPEMPEEEK